MSGINNRGGVDALSLVLFGNLANVAQLADLQSLLGGNNNNSNNTGQFSSNNFGQSIEQQLLALGLPTTQQQVYPLLSSFGRNMGQKSVSSSLSQVQSGGDFCEDNMQGKLSVSSRNRIGSSVSGQSESAKKQEHIVSVPCRARGMPMEHNFQVRAHLVKQRPRVRVLFGLPASLTLLR
jgi:hypothetical protein